MQRSTSAAVVAPSVPDGPIDAWGHPPHHHELGHFVTAVVGAGVLIIDDREHAFDATQGVWVPAGVEHAGRFGDDLVPLALDLVDHVPSAGVRDVAIDPSLRRVLVTAARASDPTIMRACERDLAYAIDCAPVVREALRIPVGELTAPVVTYLRATPAHVPPLAEWAERLHTSVATIRRAFLAETGRPYSEWTTLFRLELSIAHLLAGDPVGSVARTIGFSTNGYGLAFRRWTGLTPSEFRARANG